MAGHGREPGIDLPGFARADPVHGGCCRRSRGEAHHPESGTPGSSRGQAHVAEKPLIPRGRRRPCPLAKITNDLKKWFHEDPSQTGRELLDSFSRSSGCLSDGLIRTVQRRVKIWRGDIARALVFGVNRDAHKPTTPDALRDMEATRNTGHRESPEPDIYGRQGTNV